MEGINANTSRGAAQSHKTQEQWPKMSGTVTLNEAVKIPVGADSLANFHLPHGRRLTLQCTSPSPASTAVTIA
jgi:hypothetical protein